MGDNRSHSFDSRDKGTFPDYTVFGSEVLRYWPFDDSQVFELPEYSFKPIDAQTAADLRQFRGQTD
jgi:hypothetical protein